MLDIEAAVAEEMLHIDFEVQLPPENLMNAVALPSGFDEQDVGFDEYDWAFDE